MEFRNHQIRIGHTLAQFRGNPLALVLLVLLIPIALAVVLFVGVLAILGIVVMRVAQGITGTIMGRPSASPRDPASFPFGGAQRTGRNSPSPTPPPSGGTIDVEVVRRSDET